jgi:hypothetical protein
MKWILCFFVFQIVVGGERGSLKLPRKQKWPVPLLPVSVRPEGRAHVTCFRSESRHLSSMGHCALFPLLLSLRRCARLTFGFQCVTTNVRCKRSVPLVLWPLCRRRGDWDPLLTRTHSNRLHCLSCLLVHKLFVRTVLTPGGLGSTCAGYEVLTASVMKSAIFLDIMPCSPLKVNRRFGGTYRLHLQGRRISRASFHAGFLLGLVFDAEDGGDMILRNVGWLSTHYTALFSKR